MTMRATVHFIPINLPLGYVIPFHYNFAEIDALG
jgi:hypothetical protein